MLQTIIWTDGRLLAVLASLRNHDGKGVQRANEGSPARWRSTGHSLTLRTSPRRSTSDFRVSVSRRSESAAA
jgi:hypothetical protein